MRAAQYARRALGPRDPEIRPAGAAAPELAVAFVGRLSALGPAGWALVVADARAGAAPRAGAPAILYAVVADLRLGGAERQVAQAVAAMLLRVDAAHLPPGSRSTGHFVLVAPPATATPPATAGAGLRARAGTVLHPGRGIAAGADR